MATQRLSFVDDALRDEVATLLRSVGAKHIVPAFHNLSPEDIEEKSKGELVTRVDRAVEIALADGLHGIASGARVIGEEAAEYNPSILDDIGRGWVWIVDPIDGTANFIAGRAPFGTMVALAVDGVVHGAWIFDPLSERMCFAALGQGAWINGVRLCATGINRDRPVAALATQFMADVERIAIEARARELFDLVPIPRCAAEHYPRVALAANDVALFQRTLPWDHAAGVLFLEEAGGLATRWNGDPYRIDDAGVGLLVASCRVRHAMAAAALIDELDLLRRALLPELVA